MHTYLLTSSLLLTTILFGLNDKPAVVDPITHDAMKVIMVSNNNGTTWKDGTLGLPKPIEIDRIAAQESAVYLTLKDGLYRYSSKSQEAGWKKELFLPHEIENILPGKGGPFISAWKKGILQKLESSDVWISTGIDVGNRAVRNILERDNGEILVSTDAGIFKSKGRNQAFDQVHAGEWVHRIFESNGVLIAHTNSGILKSINDGDSWNKVQISGGTVQNVKHINRQLYAIVREENPIPSLTLNISENSKKLMCSVDNGLSWKLIEHNLEHFNFVNDIIEHKGELFASHNAGISKSNNMGRTWELVYPYDGKLTIQLLVSGDLIFAMFLAGC